MFDLFPIFFMIVFVIVIGTFVSTAVRGARQWSKNNASPVLSVEAKIVSRRQDTRHHTNNNGNQAMHSTSSTSYYTTFEVESGDRMELALPGAEFGLLAEGDYGTLTFQGTRYLSFRRESPSANHFDRPVSSDQTVSQAASQAQPAATGPFAPEPPVAAPEPSPVFTEPEAVSVTVPATEPASVAPSTISLESENPRPAVTWEEMQNAKKDCK